jgi:hypothetical protein
MNWPETCLSPLTRSRCFVGDGFGQYEQKNVLAPRRGLVETERDDMDLIAGQREK